MILGDNMSIIWCYENVSNDYILDVINILKQENIQIAPMCILNDFTVPHIYVHIADCQIFGPKCAAAMLVDYIKHDIIHDFTDIYLTNDIQYIRSDILKLPDNYCIQCGEKFNESEMRLYYIKSTNDKFTLCKKCLHDNLPPTHNLTNAKCLSIFIRSNSDITCFCQYNIKDAIHAFSKCFNRLCIPYTIQSNYIVLKCGRQLTFYNLSDAHNDTCYMYDDAYWIITEDAIISCNKNNDVAYDAAISLINKARCIDKKRSVNLNAIIDTVLEENPTVIEQYISGKTKVINYLIGIIHKNTNNKYNTDVILESLLPKLKNHVCED